MLVHTSGVPSTVRSLRFRPTLNLNCEGAAGGGRWGGGGGRRGRDENIKKQRAGVRRTV